MWYLYLDTGARIHIYFAYFHFVLLLLLLLLLVLVTLSLTTGTRIPDPLFPHLVPPAIMVWIFVWKYIFEPFIHILQHFVLQLSRSTNTTLSFYKLLFPCPAAVLSSQYVFSWYPFYFYFHSACIIFDVSSGFYLWNVNNTKADICNK